VLALGGLGDVLDQAHAHRADGADRLEHGQRLVAVDRGLQLGAGVAECRGIDEDGRDAGVDQRGLEAPTPGTSSSSTRLPVGNIAPPSPSSSSPGSRNSSCDLGGREGHAVQFEVAGFLHLAVGHRHVRRRWSCRCWPARCARSQMPSRGTRPASTRPLAIANGPTAADRLPQLPLQSTKACVDRHLAVEVVDIVIRHRRRADDHHLAGARRGPAHAVGLLAVRDPGCRSRAAAAHRARLARRAAPSGRSSSVKNTPLLVPPRM
jgi:hypothetical protein